jgi:hypothetical protein
VERRYHTIDKNDTQALSPLLTPKGQALLPMVELIEHPKYVKATRNLIDDACYVRVARFDWTTIERSSVAASQVFRWRQAIAWRGCLSCRK